MSALLMCPTKSSLLLAVPWPLFTHWQQIPLQPYLGLPTIVWLKCKLLACYFQSHFFIFIFFHQVTFTCMANFYLLLRAANKSMSKLAVFPWNTGKWLWSAFNPVFFRMWGPLTLSDNHNYALHFVMSHTQGCYLQNLQVAECTCRLMEDIEC